MQLEWQVFHIHYRGRIQCFGQKCEVWWKRLYLDVGREDMDCAEQSEDLRFNLVMGDSLI